MQVEDRHTANRGTFDGSYPRQDRARDTTRDVPLRAAFESLSAGDGDRAASSDAAKP